MSAYKDISKERSRLGTWTEIHSRQNASNNLAACRGKGQVDNHTSTTSTISTVSASMFSKGLIYLLPAHDFTKRIQTTFLQRFSKRFGPMFNTSSGELE